MSRAGPLILFQPYDVLSSVTRQLMLARAFRDRGHEVAFAGEGPYLDLVREEGFALEALPNFGAERLLQRVRAFREHAAGMGRLAVELWRDLDLATYVDAELACLRALGPDVVISEERLTAQLSARIAGVPHVSLRNTYRTPHSALPMIELRGPLRRVHPDPVEAQNTVLRWLSAPFFLRFRAIWRRHGMREPLTYEGYLEGDDRVLLCDVPEMAPARSLPDRYVVIGPLVWEPDLPDPPWLDALPGDRSAIYLSLGSSGTPELFRLLAAEATREGIPLVIATGRQVAASDLPRGDLVHVAELLPGGRVLARCGLCICHGGNGTVYQALGQGVPLVCVPTHLEQRVNARRVAELGLGAHLELDELSARPAALVEAIRAIRADPAVGPKARAYAERIATFDAPAAAVDAVEELLRERREGRPLAR